MDSDSPTNQGNDPISRDQWDKQAERLIELSKVNRELRRTLVKALLRPGNYLSGPRIETKKVLSALRVADIAGSTVYFERGDLSALNRWRKVWEILLGLVRQELARPMLRVRDVRQLKIVLREIQQLAGSAPGIDWSLIQEDLKVLELTAKRYDGFPKGPPRRGRNLTEHQKRIIACFELLRQCGIRNPCQEVAEGLWDWGIDRKLKTISNLWSRYKKYPRRHPEREHLPGYWVKIILFSIRPQVNAWIQTQANNAPAAGKKTFLN